MWIDSAAAYLDTGQLLSLYTSLNESLGLLEGKGPGAKLTCHLSTLDLGLSIVSFHKNTGCKQINPCPQAPAVD